MSRVDDLIAELAPLGVEFAPLGEVFKMRAGTAIRASEIVAEPTEDFRYPCYGGNGPRGFVRAASHAGLHLLIGRQGALCGNVKRVNGDFYATEHAVVVSAIADIDLNWAYHLLVHMDLNQYATKSAQPGLAVGNLERLRMPVPPIEVQREIAKVLDTFAELETELEAELEARQAQYGHYRDRLLTFPEAGGGTEGSDG